MRMNQKLTTRCDGIFLNESIMNNPPWMPCINYDIEPNV